MRLPPASTIHTLFWQFLPVTILFYSSMPCSYRSRRLGAVSAPAIPLEGVEPLQLVLGLSIPALIITHIVGVRLGQTLYGHEKLYPQELLCVTGRMAVPGMADVVGA